MRVFALSPGRALRRAALPLLLGACAFLTLLGPTILPPWREGWLTIDGDFATFHLSWLYYRDTAWAWPPAANPRYGIELGSSLFYGDLVPLVAIPMKALSRLVPIGQFTGPWILACFLLHGVFAWAVLARPGVGRSARVLGCLLLLFAPFLMFRLYQHVSLIAQWIVLAALWLALRPSLGRRPLAWALVVAVAALLNAYLLVMVGAIWAADALRRGAEAPRTAPALLAEAVAMLSLAVGGVWLGGYFFISAGLPWGRGYGWYGMDLLGPLIPDDASLLLPNWATPLPHEGQAVFLGTGGLLVLVAAGVAVARRPGVLRGLGRFWPLALALAGLLVIAVTNRVTIAGFGPFELPLPGWLLGLLEPLRSSNRFAWPALYAALVLAVVLVARHLPQAIGLRVLLLAAALQVGDTVGAWVPYHLRLASAPALWSSPLQDPFWAEAGGRYRRLRQIMPTGTPAFWNDPAQRDWAMLARYAHAQGWDTDVAYLARVPSAARVALQAETAARIASRAWEPGALYVVQPEMRAQVQAAVVPGRDRFEPIDGILVFAPGWFAP